MGCEQDWNNFLEEAGENNSFHCIREGEELFSGLAARLSSEDDEPASASRSARCLIPTNCLCCMMKWTRRMRMAFTGLGNFKMIGSRNSDGVAKRARKGFPDVGDKSGTFPRRPRVISRV